MIEDVIEKLKPFGRIYFTGDGVDAYGDIISDSDIGSRAVFAPEEIRYQHASTVAGLALIKASSGDTVDYDDLLPEYMRLAEAEQRLKEGTLSDKISKLTGR